ncbi:MAG: DUF1501 domain-containing protein [Verrucomicrobiota bacterium]
MNLIKSNNPNAKIQHTRRSFMAQSACSAMGLTGIVSTIAHLKLMQGALADTVTGLTDYQALLVLFNFGGTDTNNVLIPGPTHSARVDTAYGLPAGATGSRGILNLPASDQGAPAGEQCVALTVGASDSADGETSWDVHPQLGDLAAIFNDTTAAGAGVVGGGNPAGSGHASPNIAFCANVGTMIEPITPATWNSVNLPPQLFSHSDQQIQWQSSLSDKPFQSGWAGRIADLLHAGNTSSLVSMSISLAGINDLQVGLGQDPVQYSVTTSGSVSLNGYGANYSNALTDAGIPTSYSGTGGTPRRLKAFQDINNYVHAHLFEDTYTDIVQRARDNEGFVLAATQEADTWVDTGTTPNRPRIESIFLSQFGEDPNGTDTSVLPGLGEQLLMIAKLIAGRKCLGNKKQIFFCSYGGHDTHQDQGGYGTPAGGGGNTYVAGDIDTNMATLNNSLKAFNDCMIELEDHEATLSLPAGEEFEYNDVLVAQHSDFNRTFTPNGTIAGPAGSDHAYGTHMIVMGGDVIGGKIYGYYPDCVPTGAWNTPTGNDRGRWVPTGSVEQFVAPLASWLGIDSFDGGTGSVEGKDIETILPNLRRFASPFVSGAGTHGDYSSMIGSANMNFLDGHFV